jgi:hypothetical protein
MSKYGSFQAIHDADLAESIVMQAYVQLPLLPRQLEGRWVAPLTRCGDGEVRLAERAPMAAAQSVLQVGCSTAARKPFWRAAAARRLKTP